MTRPAGTPKEKITVKVEKDVMAKLREEYPLMTTTDIIRKATRLLLEENDRREEKKILRELQKYVERQNMIADAQERRESRIL